MAKLIKIKPFFTDKRGEMSHLIKTGTVINSALLITCEKGAIRANHLHKKDSHYSYVLEGKMEYYFKSEKGKKISKLIVKKGEAVYTPAGEVHAMKFLEKSTFLALTTGLRTHSKYENDTTKAVII